MEIEMCAALVPELTRIKYDKLRSSRQSKPVALATAIKRKIKLDPYQWSQTLLLLSRCFQSNASSGQLPRDARSCLLSL
jgi:hypothetical protein